MYATLQEFLETVGVNSRSKGEASTANGEAHPADGGTSITDEEASATDGETSPTKGETSAADGDASKTHGTPSNLNRRASTTSRRTSTSEESPQKPEGRCGDDPLDIRGEKREDTIIAVMGPTGSGKSSVTSSWNMGLFDLFRGSKKTSAILPTDIIVFIVGPSDSGKSWFMSVLLKHAQVRVSMGQKPGTTEIHAERCRFDGMKNDIVIVDTPSFDTDEEGPDGETEVKKWMDSNYTKPCKAAGVLYMHNVASNPDDPGLKVSNHLGAFRRTCRPKLIPRVIQVVPTLDHGARLLQEKIITRVTHLGLQANDEGAQLCNASAGYTFDGQPGTAWDIIQGLLSRLNL